MTGRRGRFSMAAFTQLHVSAAVTMKGMAGGFGLPAGSKGGMLTHVFPQRPKIILHFMRHHDTTKRAFFALCLAGLTVLCSKAPAQTLTHRYSFNDPSNSTTFADSVGGAAWNGTLVANATLNGNSLVLPGDGASFATLPDNVIAGETQLTVEFWADFATNFPWTRVFAFGSQTANGTKGSGVDYCHFAGGNYQNLDLLDTNGVDAYANNPQGLDTLANQHVTVVVDCVNSNMYYYNGTTVASTPHWTRLPSLAESSDTFNTIGRSFYDVDPTLNGTIHEFRIYNGVVAPSQIALNDAAGPDNYVTNPGPAVALHFGETAGSLVVNQSAPETLTGDFATVSNVNLLLYGGGTFTSGNTSVVTVDSNGVVKGIGPGSTTVVVSYGSLKATNTFSVANPPARLAHRYSFTSDASDSVGGANGTLEGDASISGGQVNLDGTAGTYVSLPGNVLNLSTNAAVTFEAWTTIGATPQWSRLFEFGNTVGVNGANAVYCAPAADAGGFHEFALSENFPTAGQTISWAHGWDNLTLHITCVVDPTTSAIQCYTNGVLMAGVYNATAPLTEIATNNAYLGRSGYASDPYFLGSIDEFRIYSGALTAAQVAASDKSGPNTASFDPCTLQSITVAATNYPAWSPMLAPVVTANYSGIGNLNLMPNIMANIVGLTVTSSDTNIIRVGPRNILTTRGSGSVTLTATLGGKSSSATVTVGPAAVLTHRYSFTTDATDSVGGADGTLVGTAVVTNGQVGLDGGSGDYISLPPGLLENYRSATLEFWATIDSSQGSWSRVFQFADVGPATANELYFSPSWNNPPNGSFTSYGVPAGGAGLFVSGALTGMTLHVTCVVGDGSMDVYTNGVLYATASGVFAPVSQAGILGSWLGYSPYGDPGITGSIDEYRIYNGRLTPQQIAQSDALGPNQLLAPTGPTLVVTQSGGNVVISWPASAGGTLQSTSNLGPGATWSNVSQTPTIVGGSKQVTLAASGTAQFFRLAK